MPYQRSTQPNIEGNPIDFNSYLGSKFKGRGIVQGQRPEGGDAGGNVVATGTPEEIMKVKASHTGRYLKEHLSRSNGHHR